VPAIPQRVLDLIDTFQRNADEYRSAEFNEANLRIQFINPLFKTLGWDIILNLDLRLA
jgi:nitrogen fixation/metabolism regulation signal transduction histidine kinase